MKKIIQYILLLVMGTVVSCQTPELVEEVPSLETGAGVYGKVPIVFRATFPGVIEPNTKVMDHTPDINSFHLVVFDENGMFVEVAQAEMKGKHITNNGRDYEQEFTVVLTLSDQPRIIHFIANCPVDQIAYGHEASIIGNMYVENGETAYWSRAEVPHIQVLDEVFNPEDGTEHFHPCPHLENHLEHIHLLRNFAEILVEDKTGDTDHFQLMGFSVYNTIDRGTIAPYNNKNQRFQCFVDEEEAKGGNEVIYDYEELMSLEYPYEGHALSSATLNQNMPKDANDEYIWYGPDVTNPNKEQKHFFMYERKVSIRTDEEDKWRESPPHVIVKAKYNGEECYYKFDLVYNIIENNVVTDIKYFHILRNFLYRFEITDVHSKGYKTPEEAVKGITSNNLAGSTTTSTLKEVAVGQNRMSVSFTDTTVVNSGTINFRYMYEPNYSTSDVVANGPEYVSLYDVSGDVISSHTVAQTDISSGDWAGYRNVVLNIEEPGNTIVEQIFTVRPQDYQLTRKIRVRLRKKLKMLVECRPRIKSGIDVEQYVQIKIQPGLTSDMFPLQLAIETEDLSLSPDATRNSIPVQPGKSTIPSKNGKNTFYYVYTIDSYDDYNNPAIFPLDENNYRIINTYWRTSCVDNASTVYVTNKYFDIENASDSWTNVNYAWSNVAVSTQNIPKGLDREVSITFTKDASDNEQRQVEVTLDGMKYNGNSTFTVTIPANTKTHTVNGLKTTTEEGKVGFTLDNAQYMLASAESGERVGNRFENADFVQGSVGLGIGNEVQYSFKLPTYYSGMEVNVTLDGLAPADDETRLETPAGGRSAIKSYVFKPEEGTDTYTLKLKTTNKDESTCSLMLEAEKYYYETVTSTIEQTAAKYAFQSLTISDVRYGTGRAASITFVLDTDDNNIRNKEVYVTLVGMTRDGKTSFTYNTGNVANDRQVTINNLVTTSDGDNLRVTVEAAEYMPITTTISQRTLGEFKNVKFNKTKVGAKVGEVVELSFNVDNNSYYSGMVVNLELDGLEPVDGLELVDGNYSYTVTKSGDHKISLRTTQAIEGGECKAQLKADGMVDSQVVTVEQTAATYALKITNTNRLNDSWRAQARYTFSEPLQNTRYTFKCWIKSSVRNQITLYLQNKTDDSQSNAHTITNIGADWTEVTITLNPGSNTRNSLVFNIADVVGDVYIDKVSLIRDNDANKDEVMINNDFDEYDLVNGIKVPKGWDTKINNSNNTNPVCSVEQVEGGYEP